LKKQQPGQEFYDKVYGEGEVKTEEEFTKRVQEEISGEL
jgi:hypothetical protein